MHPMGATARHGAAATSRLVLRVAGRVGTVAGRGAATAEHGGATVTATTGVSCMDLHVCFFCFF
jgi:predicted membrane-bound dolichyl-phosphate-mannose-protein mannosyltransferase